MINQAKQSAPLLSKNVEGIVFKSPLCASQLVDRRMVRVQPQLQRRPADARGPVQKEDFGLGGEGPGRLCLRAPAASSHRALQQPQLPPRVAGPGLVGGTSCTSPELDFLFAIIFFLLSLFFHFETKQPPRLQEASIA